MINYKSNAVIICAVFAASFLFAGDAEDILKKSEVKGGLIVVLGCDDHALIEKLHAGDRYVVQALDTDIEKINKARTYLHKQGVYGAVSVIQFDGKNMPYVEDSVNLLVASGEWQVASEEIKRVLAPRGVLLASNKFRSQVSSLSPQSVGEGFVKYTKPVAADVDEWTHFLHDASGNAVAKDTQVGSPTKLRWLAGPRWCRTHEIGSSVGVVVTSGGRIFTMYDEGVIGTYQKLPDDMHLVARDASNGKLLWKIPMPEWQRKYGLSTGNRWQIHHSTGRRLIAKDDRVFVTLKFLDSPVSMIDAATGEILVEAFESTKGAEEMILSDRVLVAKTGAKLMPQADKGLGNKGMENTLVAIDPYKNKQLWKKEKIRVYPYSLVAQDGKLVYNNADEFVCLDLKSGKEIWRIPFAVPGGAQTGQNVVLIHDGILLYNGMFVRGKQKTEPAKQKRRRGRGSFVCAAFSMKDGAELWSAPGSGGAGAACPQSDLFVINDVVWPGISNVGYDLKTGEAKKRLQLGKLVSPGHHARCLRSKATENFLIRPKRGAEFIDLEGSDHMRNDWLRAPCFSGSTPANGLFYKPPDQCFCYPGVKVLGYMAMASGKSDAFTSEKKIERLTKGPSYSKATKLESKISSSDWPMHRHDGQRSGSTSAKVSSKLKQGWKVQLASTGTQPVVVDDKLWIVEKDKHRVLCLDTDNGKELWSYTAGGRIDSAPTVSDGKLLFGCKDGAVYCLNAEDGEWIWRFLAAPDDKRIISHEQPESVWPIHGSVLVQDEVVYFAAGRSSFLDGGIKVYGLDVNTGEEKYSHHLEGPWPDIMTETGRPFAMEGSLTDLFVSDGEDLYMQRVKYDAELNRLKVIKDSDLGELDMGKMHLTATGGFLDDSGYDRIYWMHSKYWPGFYFSNHAPKSGQLLVFNDTTTFATKYYYKRFQWSVLFVPGEEGYPVFADKIDNEPVFLGKNAKKEARLWVPGANINGRQGGKGTEKGTGYVRNAPPEWLKMMSVRTRAMVLAFDKLLLAGTPDVLEDGSALPAISGQKGAVLRSCKAEDGSLIQEIKLDAEPVFDGMIAADGKVFISNKDASLVCYE
ncbi:MAG: PQQ-binding-like beta-propeller repeat protein [Kiritimatiellae bacterium]|nr:PQQ-binding-like beta-propeller repeat protein [Kiritimatiellia bacterium]